MCGRFTLRQPMQKLVADFQIDVRQMELAAVQHRPISRTAAPLYALATA
jgi:hypothetical protein